MRSTDNAIYRYGNEMPGILNEIKQLHRQGTFRDMPIGPLGMHVELVEMDWALAVESCISGIKNNFIFRNHADERQLQQLFQRIKDVRRRPRIIVTRFSEERYDVSRNVSLIGSHVSKILMWFGHAIYNDTVCFEKVFKFQGVKNIIPHK